MLRGPASHVKQVQNDLVHALFGKHQRNLVDRMHIFGGDDRFRTSTSQNSAIFSFISCGRGAFGAAQQNIGLNTDGAQFFDAVLRRLGFQFLRGGDPGHQRQMNEQRVLAAFLMAHLADGFDKWQRFNIAHCSADLDNGDIHVGRRLCGRRP